MAKVSSGTGQGGKSFQDRELAASVRTLALEEIKDVLLRATDDELYDGEFKKALLLRLAGSILPRLNEVTGPDGTDVPLVVRFIDAKDSGHTD